MEKIERFILALLVILGTALCTVMAYAAIVVYVFPISLILGWFCIGLLTAVTAKRLLGI